MESYLKCEKDFPDKMIRISKAMEDIAASNQQVDTDIHMVGDSIDIMADTSDSLSDYTMYLKEKTDRLKDAAKSNTDHLAEIADEICEMIEECNSLLFDFVEMSHGIQGIVSKIANDVDEITEASTEISDAMQVLIRENLETAGEKEIV